MPSNKNKPAPALFVTALTILAATSCSIAENYSFAADNQAKMPSSRSDNPSGELKQPNKSLCAPKETIYFSCETKNKKNISLCGIAENNIISSLSYKFGKAGKIELNHEWNSRKSSAPAFFKNTYSRYKTEYIEISFTRSDYEYRIFRHYDATSEADETSRGVSVINNKASENETTISCKETEKDDLSTLAKYLQCDKDSALGCAN